MEFGEITFLENAFRCFWDLRIPKTTRPLGYTLQDLLRELTLEATEHTLNAHELYEILQPENALALLTTPFYASVYLVYPIKKGLGYVEVVLSEFYSEEYPLPDSAPELTEEILEDIFGWNPYGQVVIFQEP